MKILATYSTRTGNTQRVVEAVANSLPGEVDCLNVECQPDPSQYDVLIHGFWVTGATADEPSLEYLRGICDRSIGLIGTMGANPSSAYGRSIALRLKNVLRENNNRMKAWFLCAGKIDPELIRWMETLPENHSQYPTPARRKNWEDALGHPNQLDIDRAIDAFRQALS
ncbi:MAG: flavodoxin family protein [Verrucomicrobiota bacterium]